MKYTPSNTDSFLSEHGRHTVAHAPLLYTSVLYKHPHLTFPGYFPYNNINHPYYALPNRAYCTTEIAAQEEKGGTRHEGAARKALDKKLRVDYHY